VTTGSFNITTPAALLKKLQAEQADFVRENCLSARHALNAVMTANHLHEWVWGAFLKWQPDVQTTLQLTHDAKKGRITLESFREWLDMKCPAMAVAKQITNGTKHYGAQVQTGGHRGGFQRSAFQANAFDVSYLWIERNDRKQRVEHFIAELVTFWTEFFREYQVP
jgi:hypothetical protein